MRLSKPGLRVAILALIPAVWILMAQMADWTLSPLMLPLMIWAASPFVAAAGLSGKFSGWSLFCVIVVCAVVPVGVYFAALISASAQSGLVFVFMPLWHWALVGIPWLWLNISRRRNSPRIDPRREPGERS
jgi:hypothetical protein